MSNPIDTYRELSEAALVRDTAHSLSTAAQGMSHGLLGKKKVDHEDHVAAAKAHEKAFHAHSKLAKHFGLGNKDSYHHGAVASLHRGMHNYHHIAADNMGHKHKWEPLGNPMDEGMMEGKE